jgi:hypothetical protein
MSKNWKFDGPSFFLNSLFLHCVCSSFLLLLLVDFSFLWDKDFYLTQPQNNQGPFLILNASDQYKRRAVEIWVLDAWFPLLGPLLVIAE